MIAFLDESRHVLGAHRSYLIAASLVPLDRVGEIRDSMTALRLKGQRKVHWRDEQRVRRAALLRAVEGLGLHHLVVQVHAPVREREERSRRTCLERLLREVEARSCCTVVAESRDEHLDRQDTDFVMSCIVRGALGPAMRLSHARGHEEPLLWLPDIVAGSTHRQLSQGTPPRETGTISVIRA